MKTIGIVAFSFALRENEEPSPCNIRIAKEVIRIAKIEEKTGNKVAIVAQWEVALALQQMKFPFRLNVSRKADKYLDSEEVMRIAKKLFIKLKVQEVIPVAHPFLQIIKCRKLVTQAGFRLLNRSIHSIGFDPKSDQPWTRGPVKLLIYAIKQKLFSTKGA